MPKSEPTLVILATAAERRGAGRRAMFSDRAARKTEFRLTAEQLEDLKNVAAAEGRPVTTIIRDAVNVYVTDSREKRVFVRPAALDRKGP